MKNIIWFIKKSVILDLKFIKVSSWSIKKKAIFLSKKYLEIIYHILKLKKFELGKTNVCLFNKLIYYDSTLGLAGYQSMLTRHQNLLNIAGAKDIKNVIDIGANVGFFSMMIRDNFPKCQIIAIEPARQTFIALNRNLGDDKKTLLLNVAISNKKGMSKMISDPSCSTLGRLIDDSQTEYNQKEQSEFVKTQALDSIISRKRVKHIDIIKIDTETFEKQVLLGAEKSLAMTRFLFIEITMQDNPNYTFSEINSLLFSKNYNFQLVGFRNYLDQGEGELPVGDFLYKNILLEC